MLVSVPFTMSVAKALQYLKGISAYRIFRLHSNFRLRYPKGHFWSPGKFSRTVSNVTSATITDYIERHEKPQFNDSRQLSLADF